jgi:hypothetical protein
MTWQPIETAPKDVEVWVVGLAKPWRTSMEFIWQGQSGFSEEDGRWWTTAHDDSGEPLFVKPTHWMPLPPPPPPGESA